MPAGPAPTISGGARSAMATSPPDDDVHALGERRRAGAQPVAASELHPAILAGAHLAEAGARRARKLAVAQPLDLAEHRSQHRVARAAFAGLAIDRERDRRIV